MRKLLAERGAGARFELDSAGTHDFGPGSRPLYEAHLAARKRGYELTPAATRRVTAADFDRFDLILVMDRANAEQLRGLAPTRCKHKIEMVLDYGERFHGEEVPDPVGRDARHFDIALEMIEDGCRGLAQYLLRAA